MTRLYSIRRTLNEYLNNVQYRPATFRKELRDESVSKKSLRPLVPIQEYSEVPLMMLRVW